LSISFNDGRVHSARGENEALPLMFGLRRKPSPLIEAAERLHDWAVGQSRAPALYRDMGAPDTVEGRFEMLTLHVLLLMDRLKGGGAGDLALRQHVFDRYISDLDGAMREMGVGDLVMGKRMKKLGEAFYGRAKAYEAAFGELPGRTALEGLIARTVLAEQPTVPASGWADYVLETREVLARSDDRALIEGRIGDGTEAGQ
jgi:cytochrome b pre-mRNA-processing protein 3